MLAGHEDGLAGNTVHVDASTGLEVVEVDETVLGREVDDAMSLRDLHSDGEVVRGLRWEVNIDGFLRKWRVGGLMIDLYDMKLSFMTRRSQNKLLHPL